MPEGNESLSAHPRESGRAGGRAWLNPVTRKRLMRFRSLRRAWFSFWLLAFIYVLSLGAELFCNSRPLVLCLRGNLYFPAFRHYPADTFLKNGDALSPDYKALAEDTRFRNAGGWMLWPLIESSPNEQVGNDDLEPHRRLAAYLLPVPGVATATLSDDHFMVAEITGAETLMKNPEGGLEGRRLNEFYQLPDEAMAAARQRFANMPSPEFECVCQGLDGRPSVRLKLLAYRKRSRPPKRLPARLSECADDAVARGRTMLFDARTLEPLAGVRAFRMCPPEVKKIILDKLKALTDTAEEDSAAPHRAYGQDQAAEEDDAASLRFDNRTWTLRCEREQVQHPFRPVPGHIFGLDDSGRDVFARVLYGLRTSLTFGLILVACSMIFGTAVGCVQGYMGGRTDLLGQRAIEIWSALPFLYVIILLGALFGTGFWLLIVCYALFNWIGVSYYMRAEMLRLKKMPFVEAARCLGLPWYRVVFRHILPNALVPLVTLMPFSLVGAIGALAGLDYLGFGLPPPTPSLGQLLQQAQVQREAWWLTLYPSLALFLIMLLCVFVGEGVREAFDPKRQSRLQ